MADQVCGSCALWTGGATPRCRVTNALRAIDDTCNLTPVQRLSLLKQSRLIVGAAALVHAVSVVALEACSGGSHITATYTVDGGPQRQKRFAVEDLRNGQEEYGAADEVLLAMRSMCLMCGVSSHAQAQAVLEGMTFWVGGSS